MRWGLLETSGYSRRPCPDFKGIKTRACRRTRRRAGALISKGLRLPPDALFVFVVRPATCPDSKGTARLGLGRSAIAPPCGAITRAWKGDSSPHDRATRPCDRDARPCDRDARACDRDPRGCFINTRPCDASQPCCFSITIAKARITRACDSSFCYRDRITRACIDNARPCCGIPCPRARSTPARDRLPRPLAHGAPPGSTDTRPPDRGTRPCNAITAGWAVIGPPPPAAAPPRQSHPSMRIACTPQPIVII